ncbi:MAG: nucleotide exchange factor GrpE [Nanoarchaeota archaeon]|nr:nucleotide exchange factor GrpE [Nanoarchaeota archaeon]
MTNKKNIEENSSKDKQPIEKEEPNYLEDLQRLQAEFDNFRKRTESEKEVLKKSANKDLILKLLDVLDNLENAIKHDPKNEGLKLTHKKLTEILNNEGLKKIDTSGSFNPEFHEAIQQVEGKSENKILDVYTKGYTLNEKLIRAAIVKISKLKGNQNE